MFGRINFEKMCQSIKNDNQENQNQVKLSESWTNRNKKVQFEMILKENHQKKLSCFYQKQIMGNLCASKLNYYHSLVPKITSLRENKKIVFHISLVPGSEKQRLFPENSVNIHLFKPFYVDNGSHLSCLVPTVEIMKHALSALFQVHEHYKLPQPIIACSNEDVSVKALIQNWIIRKRVIICRVESLITYLLIEWLKECFVAHEKVKEIAVQIELSRLAPQHMNFDKQLQVILQKHQLNKSQFFQYYHLVRQTSRSPFIYGFNFVYRGQKISAVMLPWGLSLAEELTKAVMALNPKICSVGLVGGVGYIGDFECEVDNIFVPNSIMVGDEFNHTIQQVENNIDLGEVNHFRGHKTVYGCMKSVYPQVGKLSNIATYRQVLHKIDALDMEFQAVYRTVKAQGMASIGAVYYIMDLPKKDIHLGDTYYTRPFLEALFRKFERGKHHCFEKTIDYLIK